MKKLKYQWRRNYTGNGYYFYSQRVIGEPPVSEGMPIPVMTWEEVEFADVPPCLYDVDGQTLRHHQYGYQFFFKEGVGE
jgi:hypothetical protein